MPSPGLLLCASNDEAARCIIKGILKDESQSSELNEAETPVWNIENKYYRAEVRLHSLVDGQNTDYLDFDSVEAFIIYINNYKGESLATANKRKEKLGEHNSEVNILVCDKCDEMFPREQTLVWCLDNDYQLIELHEEPEPVDESCPIKEYYGMDRVIQTLHTHAWSNHQPKHESAIDINVHLQHLPDDGGDEDDELEYMDQFCKLFAQMSSVTQNASTMQSEGRKAYAEQVVKAFWKAIGGDESELEDTVNS